MSKHERQPAQTALFAALRALLVATILFQFRVAEAPADESNLPPQPFSASTFFFSIAGLTIEGFNDADLDALCNTLWSLREGAETEIVLPSPQGGINIGLLLPPDQKKPIDGEFHMKENCRPKTWTDLQFDMSQSAVVPDIVTPTPAAPPTEVFSPGPDIQVTQVVSNVDAPPASAPEFTEEELREIQEIENIYASYGATFLDSWKFKPSFYVQDRSQLVIPDHAVIHGTQADADSIKKYLQALYVFLGDQAPLFVQDIKVINDPNCVCTAYYGLDPTGMRPLMAINELALGAANHWDERTAVHEVAGHSADLTPRTGTLADVIKKELLKAQLLRLKNPWKMYSNWYAGQTTPNFHEAYTKRYNLSFILGHDVYDNLDSTLPKNDPNSAIFLDMIRTLGDDPDTIQARDKSQDADDGVALRQYLFGSKLIEYILANPHAEIPPGLRQKYSTYFHWASLELFAKAMESFTVKDITSYSELPAAADILGQYLTVSRFGADATPDQQIDLRTMDAKIKAITPDSPTIPYVLAP